MRLVYVRARVRMCMCACVCLCVCPCVCTCACVCVCARAYMRACVAAMPAKYAAILVKIVPVKIVDTAIADCIAMSILRAALRARPLRNATAVAA